MQIINPDFLLLLVTTQPKLVENEKKLVLGLKKGEYASFDALFNKYAESLFAFAVSITKDSFLAEEITQDVFLKVWDKRHQIEEHYSFKSFLFSVTFNETISHLRKIKSEKNKIDSLINIRDDISHETEYEVEYRNLKSLANEIIEDFPTKRKQIFKLSREQGLTNKEISEELGISVKTVENQMTAALKTLREKLGSEGNLGMFFYFIQYHK